MNLSVWKNKIISISPEYTAIGLIWRMALFFMLFCNVAFFKNVLDVYPFLDNIMFVTTLFVVFATVVVLLFLLLGFKYLLKPLIIVNLLITSVVSYFVDTYNIIIDSDMLQNVMATDSAEVFDLFSLKLCIYILCLGVIPSIFVCLVKLKYYSFKIEILKRVKFAGVLLAVVSFVAVFYGGYYASFFREHKQLRYYSNPGSYINAVVKYLKVLNTNKRLQHITVGEDARIGLKDTDRELVIFVVGEAARADRFSLNGYNRKTNPLLEKDNVISFTNFWSSGTCTAVSVPSMFSPIMADDYDFQKVRSTENALDVLHHAGVNVLWRDNNSDSKGVALRVQYQSFKDSERNPVCDIEPRDEGMLVGLQKYIDSHKRGDIFIVLHQMGNHGPAYYKRYPKRFEVFKPVAYSNQLENISKQELNNAYDNAILYTDYFLDKVIKLLKRNDEDFETAMVYSSDHGESLGENGIYLHGLPKYIAPDAQIHVGTMFWFGKNYTDVDIDYVKSIRHKKYNHDYIFHTILGLLEIKSEVYNKNLDILH